MIEQKIDLHLLSGQVLEARFPTDEEWIRRNRIRRLIQRTVKGETSHEVEQSEAADLELFRAITGDESFNDVDEAVLVVEKLAAVEVAAIERAGEDYMLELETFLGARELRLRRPTAAHVRRFRGFVTPVDLSHGRTWLKTDLTLAAQIFDELAGGATPVPILVKVSAVSAVIAEVQRPLEPCVRP